MNPYQTILCSQANETALHESMEIYRPVASRGATIFFLVDSLPALDRVYLFSMAAFLRVRRRTDMGGNGTRKRVLEEACAVLLQEMERGMRGCDSRLEEDTMVSGW